MDGDVAAAVRPLPESGRKVLAIQALAGCETVSNLAAQHGVSRKFVGSVSAHAKPHDTSCRASSSYATSRIASAAMARRR
jgi:hypothetical protein